MPTPTIKVLCVDDSAPLVAALQRLIDTQPDMQAVGSLDRADDLPAHVAESKPDIVLLDLTMDGRDPLSALAESSKRTPECRVIVLSGHRDPELADKAFEAGAWGYLHKLSDPSDTIDAIRRVAGGEMLFPSD